ncbi:MAG: hypothetical protein KKE20_02420, partial [Nanoarchaeota archaeon]|nr:hypothetical protein [Nanoarchaeota archaeon]
MRTITRQIDNSFRVIVCIILLGVLLAHMAYAPGPGSDASGSGSIVLTDDNLLEVGDDISRRFSSSDLTLQVEGDLPEGAQYDPDSGVLSVGDSSVDLNYLSHMTVTISGNTIILEPKGTATIDLSGFNSKNVIFRSTDDNQFLIYGAHITG